MRHVARHGVTCRRLTVPARATFLAILMLLVASGRDASAEVLFSDDFDRPSSSVVGNGWVELEGSSSADVEVDDGQVRFQSSDHRGRPLLSHGFRSVTEGTVTWRFDFDWRRTDPENTYEVRMQLGDSRVLQDPALSATAGAAVDLRWSGERAHETLDAVGGGGTSTIARVSGREAIEVVADLDAGTFSVDVDPADGAVEARELQLPEDARVDTMRFFVDGLNSDKFDDRSFDDVRVSAVAPAPAPAPTPTPTPTPTPDDATGVLFEDAFDRAASSVVGNGWVEAAGSVTADAEVNDGQLRLHSSDDRSQPLVSHAFPAVERGAVTWRFAFDWARTSPEKTYAVRMQLGDSEVLRDPVFDATAGAVVDLEWSGEVADETLSAIVGGVVHPVATVSGRETIQVVADLDAGALSVDVDPADGIVEAQDVPLPANASVDTARFFVDALNGRKFAGRAFDDVLVAGATAAPDPTPTPTPTPTPSPTPVPGAGHVVTASGDRLLLDGAPFEMWGVRTASATQDQAQTDHLIAQLDEYKAHGVNAVTVFYQGSRGAAYDPFSSDGQSLDAGHRSRMEQIIRAADARGMVVVVGIFYQRASLRLRSADAVRAAVRTVTRSLEPFGNVIINIANEQNSSAWDDTEEIFDFRDPDSIIELCRIVNQEHPARLVGGGGYDDANNAVIGASPDVDVLLFDTDSPEDDSARAFDAFVEAGVDKPMVNVEMLGGWTLQFARGVFPEDVKREYYEEIAASHARDGLGLFFHSSPWMQREPMRYDLAGHGTPSDPGVRWYFERVRSLAPG